MTHSFHSALVATMLVTAVGSVFAASDARAAALQRSFVQNATGACQAALPVFEGQIRKRPLALQNEGNASAFVSCSLMGTDRTVDGYSEIYLYADNHGASAVDLTCTLITGSGGGPVAYPQTVSLPANSQTNEFVWTAENNGGNNFSEYTANMSCNLPVGVGLTISFVYYNEDIGA